MEMMGEVVVDDGDELTMLELADRSGRKRGIKMCRDLLC